MAAVSQVAIPRPLSHYTSLEDAFPPVDPGLIPYGSRVLVQLRRAKTRTASGIVLAAESRAVEHDLTQIGKIIRLGPLAFKNRDRMETWPEGEWCKVGEFVRVPQYGGDKWGVPIPDETNGFGSQEYATFAVFDDLDLIGRISGDPLAVIAYV